MTINSPPPPHRHGYSAAPSTLTKDRPSGSWLLANNPTLAFSSFSSNGANDQPMLSTKRTTFDSSYSGVATKTETIEPSNAIQRTHRQSPTTQKSARRPQDPIRNISFDTEFPTLTSMSSPLTPTTDNRSSTTQHAWSNAQRIQHKVKSPAKSPWHGEGSDKENDDHTMEIERLKALVPRRHSHHQGGSSNTSSSSPGAHRQRISSTSTSRVVTTGRKCSPPRPWASTDRTTTATIAATATTAATAATASAIQYDDSSTSSTSSSGSSILSPPPPLSPITTNTCSTTTNESTCPSTHLNDVVTKRDQLRFYLFLKKWTGQLVCDSAGPSGWQQQQRHHISAPPPIGTQKYDNYATPFYS